MMNLKSKSYAYKIETILNILIDTKLQIGSLNTGGYEITVTEGQKMSAALIANTVVTDFRFKVKNKNLKSEKALDVI